MKEIRQRTIRKILGKTQVQNQDELLNLLAVEGIQTTQATLSRDLKEMRVVKLHKADGGYFFSIPAESMHVVPDAAHSTSGIVSLWRMPTLALLYAVFYNRAVYWKAPEEEQKEADGHE